MSQFWNGKTFKWKDERTQGLIKILEWMKSNKKSITIENCKEGLVNVHTHQKRLLELNPLNEGHVKKIYDKIVELRRDLTKLCENLSTEEQKDSLKDNSEYKKNQLAFEYIAEIEKERFEMKSAEKKNAEELEKQRNTEKKRKREKSTNKLEEFVKKCEREQQLAEEILKRSDSRAELLMHQINQTNSQISLLTNLVVAIASKKYNISLQKKPSESDPLTQNSNNI